MNTATVLKPVPVPPSNARFADIPAGSYALWSNDAARWDFFTVSRPKSGKWVGWTFLKQHFGANCQSIRGAQYAAVMSVIQRNPAKCAANYGKQTNECGQCHTQLTNPKSIAKGIGPDCEKKFPNYKF